MHPLLKKILDPPLCAVSEVIRLAKKLTELCNFVFTTRLNNPKTDESPMMQVNFNRIFPFCLYSLMPSALCDENCVTYRLIIILFAPADSINYSFHDIPNFLLQTNVL